MMKKNIFFLIAISTGLSLHGGVLYLQNLYRKPIQVKINGQVIQGALIKTGETARLISIQQLQSLAIKTPESLQFKNLDTELKKAKNDCPLNGDVILTIPDTNNILYWKPGIVTCRSAGFAITKQLIDFTIGRDDFLNKLTQHPNPYGTEYADKVNIIKNVSSEKHYVGDIRNNPLNLLNFFLGQKIAGTNVTPEQAEMAIKNTINELINVKIPSLRNMDYIK
jgi:hypothetical protein